MVEFIARPLPGPLRYAAATPWRGVLHTTEGSTTSTYKNGTEAPQLTVSVQQRRTWLHYDYRKYAGKALKHPLGTPETNRTRCVQIEVIGFCDPAKASSPFHIGKWTEDDYAYLASVMRRIEADTGIPRRTGVKFKPYPGSFGPSNGVRLGWAAWAAYNGWLGHQHVPGNVHGDPGGINIAKLLVAPPPPPTQQEDDDVRVLARFHSPHPKAPAAYVTDLKSRRGVINSTVESALEATGVDQTFWFTTDEEMLSFAGPLEPDSWEFDGKQWAPQTAPPPA